MEQLGNYIFTSDFGYQENVRRLSVTGFGENDKFYYNGWSQLISMIQLYEKHQVNLSEELKLLVDNIINKYKENIDIDVNIRGDIKKFLMWPYPNYFNFSDYKNQKLLDLCKTMNNKIHLLKVVNGKLYLMVPLNQKLEKIRNNPESVHITVINSDKFQNHHNQYDDFEIDDVEYFKLSSTYSRDYPLFANVIVVNCKSEKIFEMFGKNELHFTIKVVLRKPYEF